MYHELLSFGGGGGGGGVKFVSYGGSNLSVMGDQMSVMGDQMSVMGDQMSVMGDQICQLSISKWKDTKCHLLCQHMPNTL